MGDIDRMVIRRLDDYPKIRLMGTVDEEMVRDFLKQYEEQHDKIFKSVEKTFVLELTTYGGKADYGYRIAEEIRIAREYHGLDPSFIGKTFVYSAGMTILAAFPKNRRYLTQHTTLLTHERRVEQDVKFLGPMIANIQVAKEILADFENGKRIEDQNFAQVVQGSDVSFEEIVGKAQTGWYIPAEEALRRGLVEGLI